MGSLPPLRKRILVSTFSFALLLFPALSASAQRRRQQPEPSTVEQTLSTALALGSALIDSTASNFSEDPYAQFRNARYSNAGLINERDEIKLGNQLNIEVGKKYTLVRDGQARANRIGQRVARMSLRPNLPYSFHVMHDEQINAFSGPGGHIYVTDALMNRANDAELASVLSHEVGHVVARHSLKTIQQSQTLGGLAELFGSITGVAGDAAGDLGKAAAQIVAGGLLAVHNREEEREADFLGLRAMVKAGFDPEGMVSMFQQLQNISKTDSNLLGSLFNDHPDVQERIDNTRYEINRLRNEPRPARRR
ncbi:MAG TPA: M48 family metallopeptidase [Pyrinomonadaceae bacterium]|jgi:predicted Zn-dependent protease